MKRTISIFLSACMALPAASNSGEPAIANSYGWLKNQGQIFPMKYEGGSVSMGMHDKMKMQINSETVWLYQGKLMYHIPAHSITEISYGSDVHRRVGAAIGVGAVTLGLGAMLLFAKTKKHYVGIVWLDSLDKKQRGGVVCKVGKGEYRGVLAALQGATGLRPVDADAIGSGGTSR